MCSRKWLIMVLMACGLASACSQYNTNLSIQTSSSVLSFVSPSSVTAGTQGFTITANGGGFTTGALILWNGTALNTTLVSAIQLTAPVPTPLLAAPGSVKIAVQIPGSAQSATSNVNNTTTTEVSNIVYFTISAPPGTPPAITSVSTSTTGAASAPYCSAQGFTLTVNGTNFTSDSIVNWNGTPEPTTFASATPTQLTATIPATAAAFPGTAVVTVTNSIGTSPSSPVTLTTPSTALAPPVLTSLSQTSAGAGTSALTLTLTGSSFLPCSVVQWTSPSNVVTTLPTVYNSAAQLTATVPPADFLATGTAKVSVFTLGPGGGTSSPISFTINGPTITSLSSNSTPSCSASNVVLTVTGTNFVNDSVVNWVVNPPPALPSSLATTFVSSTQLTAIVPAPLIASSGSVQIQVSNSGVLSSPVTFTVSPTTPPAATISTVLPAIATAGAAGTTLTVTGTNILPCSVVQWTSGATTNQLPTTYVSATLVNPAELIATVPAALVASPGQVQLSVVSPASSTIVPTPFPYNIKLATVTSLSASTTTANNTPVCSPAGLTLSVNGTNFANGLTVNWNGSPRPTTFVSATQLTAAITAADTAFLASASSPVTVAITVSGPNPGTNSNSLPFSVTTLPTGTTLPTPVLSSISPTSAATEVQTGPAIALTLNGNNLSPCSVAQWNGNPLPATIFIGTGGIASFIPAANLNTTGTNQISATTPGPGASNSEPFSVYTPGSPILTNVPGGSLSLSVLSASQRFGVFVLASPDGTTETPGTTQNIFLKDTCLGVASGCTASTTLVSAATNSTPGTPVPGNADSVSPSISANSAPNTPDGRYVAFLSSATNLITGGTNGLMQAFVRDTCAGVATGCTPSTQIVSVSTATPATQANAAVLSATIDATGRYVTFESSATNLGSTSSSSIGLFVRDTCTGAAPGCTPTTQPLN